MFCLQINMCRIYGDWFAPHWLVMISDSGKWKNFDSFALDKLQFQGNGVKLSIIEDRAARMSISDVCVCLVELGWNPYLLIEICVKLHEEEHPSKCSCVVLSLFWWCVVLHIRICFVITWIKPEDQGKWEDQSTTGASECRMLRRRKRFVTYKCCKELLGFGSKDFLFLVILWESSLFG